MTAANTRSRAAARPTDYRVDPFDLQLFEAVVAQGSITAGAAAMGLSLAAASARLKALEHRVGVRLLDRAKTGAAATDAGRALSRQAHRVLAELDSLHVAMSAFGHGLRGTVRLLGNTAAIVEALPPRLGPFLAAHPDIDLELQEMPSDAALQALRDGVADVAVVADHVDTAGLSAHAWLDDELVALLPASPRRRAASIRFVELLDRPFVGLGAESGLSRFLQAQAARSGRVPKHRVRVSGFEAIARLVEAGAGVAVMPRSAAKRQMTAGLRMVALADAWARRTLRLAQRLPGAVDVGAQRLQRDLQVPTSTSDLIPVRLKELATLSRRVDDSFQEPIRPDNLADFAGTDLLLDIGDLLVDGFDGSLHIGDRRAQGERNGGRLHGECLLGAKRHCLERQITREPAGVASNEAS